MTKITPTSRGEDHVDERRDELLGVGPNLLELAQRLAAPLVLEDLEGQGQRVANSVGVELRAQPLRYNVDEVVLEVLGHAGDERDTNGHREEERDSAKELSVGELVVLGGVVVDDVAEDQRVEQRKDLIDRREDQSERDQGPVAAQITGEKRHDRNIGAVGREPPMRSCSLARRRPSGTGCDTLGILSDVASSGQLDGTRRPGSSM